MSRPFANRDFLEGRWEKLTTLAQKQVPGGGYSAFPAQLPDLSALDLDKIKDDICAYRGWGLCSVDAVTLSSDGRIIFIEFKDTHEDERAWIRKKGFDSLFLFWLAAGQTLTMEEIRDRAVFWYVTPTVPEPSDSERLSQARQMAGWHRSQRSLPDQVEYLSIHGLYRCCRHLSADTFSAEVQSADVAQSTEKLRSRLAVMPNMPGVRPMVPSVVLTDNFEASVSKIAELRMEYPFDMTIHGYKPFEVLRVATKYDASSVTASFKHDWRQQYAVMRLMACCFDTFMMWCLAFHVQDRMELIGTRLNGMITFDDVRSAPSELREPSNIPRDAWLHRFWSVYMPYFQDSYGLRSLELAGLYQSLSGTVSDDVEMT